MEFQRRNPQFSFGRKMRISFMFITIALMKGAVSAQCTFGPDTPSVRLF
jgi:H+/gluconate symporter-like permease